MSEQSIFEGFDKEYGDVAPAQPFSRDRIPPGTYKAVFTSVNLAGDGVLVDKEVIDGRQTNTSSGLKVFLEVLAPESVSDDKGNVTVTKGKILEHVFWATAKNLPYIKRDLGTIFGTPLARLSDAERATWAGRTIEIGVADEPYKGWINSRVKFFAPWTPEGSAATSKAPPASAGAPPAAPPSAGQKKNFAF